MTLLPQALDEFAGQADARDGNGEYALDGLSAQILALRGISDYFGFIGRSASMWKEVTLSPKGQITLPWEMREQLGLEPGDAVVATLEEGCLMLTPKNITFNDLAGFLGDPPNGPASLEAIDATVAAEVGRDAAASLKTAKDEAA